MKTSEIQALCEQEFLKDGGVVFALSLAPARLQELVLDILGGPGTITWLDLDGNPKAAPPPGACGMAVREVVNPATRTIITVDVSDGADTATVRDADGSVRTIAIGATLAELLRADAAAVKDDDLGD